MTDGDDLKGSYGSGNGGSGNGAGKGSGRGGRAKRGMARGTGRSPGWTSDRRWQAGFLLGSAIGAAATVLGRRAERAARRGLVDWGSVHPGILVRQPYQDDDIGMPKVSALARRLQSSRPERA